MSVKINESLRHWACVRIIRRRCEIIYTRLMSEQKDQRRMQACHTGNANVCAKNKNQSNEIRASAGLWSENTVQFPSFFFFAISAHLHAARTAFKDNGVYCSLLNVWACEPVNLFACASLTSRIININNLASFEFRTSSLITKSENQNRSRSYALWVQSAHSLIAFDLHQNDVWKLSGFLSDWQ